MNVECIKINFYSKKAKFYVISVCMILRSQVGKYFHKQHHNELNENCENFRTYEKFMCWRQNYFSFKIWMWIAVKQKCFWAFPKFNFS